MYVSLVFKRVILQQKKYETCFSVSIEIITGEKINLSFYVSVSLKNYYVLTKNNCSQYVAIVSLLTACQLLGFYYFNSSVFFAFFPTWKTCFPNISSRKLMNE